MATIAPDSDEAKRIDTALQQWRQGDYTIEENWFVHVGNSDAPLSIVADEAQGDGIQALTSEVLGLIVISQTCDIVRNCVSRPYLEVAPLVSVSKDEMLNVKRRRRPAYATLPSLETNLLVVDLDRVMTVEKAIVATWRRTPGYAHDADGRAFAQALARKRVRFAFPDDFTPLVKKLVGRLEEKHGKNTDEGRGLQALLEIRVCASPSWDARSVEVFFWFIRDEQEITFDGKDWAELLKAWLQLVTADGRFTKVDGQVVTLADMTAEDFVYSDPLDLDHLSSRNDK